MGLHVLHIGVHHEGGRRHVRRTEGQRDHRGAVHAVDVGEPQVQHIVLQLLQAAADDDGQLLVLGHVHHAVAQVAADGRGLQLVGGRHRRSLRQHGVVQPAALGGQHGGLSGDKGVGWILLADEGHIGEALSKGGHGVVRRGEGDHLHRAAFALIVHQDGGQVVGPAHSQVGNLGADLIPAHRGGDGAVLDRL